MDLVLDIGNTALKIIKVINSTGVDFKRYSLHDFETFKTYFADIPDLDAVYIGSVNQEYFDKVTRFFIEKSIQYHTLNEFHRHEIEYDEEINKDEVGFDLIADVKAARSKFETAILVIDAGTITKFLLIDEGGIYRGASFLLGIKEQIQIIQAKLPHLFKQGLNIHENFELAAKNTNDCFVSGIFGPVAGMTALLYGNYCLDYRKTPKVIITGGNGEMIYQFLTKNLTDFGDIITYDEFLTLKGIYFCFKGEKKFDA
ncbi:MAG: type III pantothenate kinase [Erysipelotrichaceae bacterium]|jgi:pantothenate kinase type III|nr:type III pantothenate kinase [Erysipelotrichaceae bacterium]